MLDVMHIDNEATWPTQVLEYLDEHGETFLNWERRRNGGPARLVSGAEYDTAVRGLRAALEPYCLHGYHCTRLTDHEITYLISHGMYLPNLATLRDRVDTLKESGMIKNRDAIRLLDKNQCDDNNRAGMIWFCFFPPHLAGQSGLERLFRSWGGEALYNSHERDPQTGPLLKRIGTPCIVEADVPIRSLGINSFLDEKVARRFLVSRGHNTTECIDHEDRTKSPIPPGNIRRIIQFPSRKFMQLTDCASWKPPL